MDGLRYVMCVWAVGHCLTEFVYAYEVMFEQSTYGRYTDVPVALLCFRSLRCIRYPQLA